MKAAIYHGIENVTVEEVAMPACGDRDVIIRNVRGSICGTDIGAYYHGGDDAGIFPGHTFGHEMSAVVWQVGPDADPAIKKGMRVFPNPCLRRPADCGMSLLEICDECGGFSEYVQIEQARLDYNLFELPENVDFDEAAIIEPFSVAMHGVNKGRIKAEDKVLIYGAGMIGLCALSACIAKGVRNIVVVDINDWRLEKAKQMGAVVFNSKNGGTKEFLQQLYGAGSETMAGQSAVDIDLFIDTSGAPGIIPDVFSMAKNYARLVVVALYHRNVEINPYQITGAELEVIGSFAYTNDDIREVIAALAAKTTPVKQIITHHYPLDQINEAFAMTKNQNESLKVIIDHRE